MRMTKKILWGLTIILIIAFTAVVLLNRRGTHGRVEVYKSEQGWGYDIVIKNKTYIHQPYMPTVNGNVAFENKHTAKKTGDLVLKKLQKRQTPVVTKSELDSLLNSR